MDNPEHPINPIWGLFNDYWERDLINFKSRHKFQFFLKENRFWSHPFSIVLKLGCCQYVSITLTLKDPQVSCYKPQTCIPQISMRYIIIIPQILPGHWYKNSPMVLHFILRSIGLSGHVSYICSQAGYVHFCLYSLFLYFLSNLLNQVL